MTSTGELTRSEVTENLVDDDGGGGVNFAQLAADNDWSGVLAALAPALRCVVRDEGSENLAAAFARLVNRLTPVSAVAGTYAAHHFLLWSSSSRPDDDSVLADLLRVGADPNLASGGAAAWRPAHYCAAKGWIRCLTALTNAGLNLDSESARPGETASVVAERNKRVEALEILNEYRATGCKPLAQLAEERLWYAVLNRLRRQCLLFGDFVRKHKGRTALEWCRAHDNVDVGDEVEYWLRKYLPPCRAVFASTSSSSSVSDARMVRDLKRLVEKQQEVLNDVVSRLIGLEAKFRSLDAETSCRLSPRAGRRSLLLLPASSASETTQLASGEAVAALDDKIASVGAVVAERDAELSRKISALEAKVFELSSLSASPSRGGDANVVPRSLSRQKL